MTKLAKDEATKSEAQALTQQVREQTKQLERGWWTLAKLIDTCISRRVPAALGLTAQAWMEENLQGSISDAWRKLRMARNLMGIPESELLRIPERNAYHLTRMPQEARKSQEWINKAVEMSVSDFQEAVEAALEKKTGQQREKFIIWRMRLPVAVAQRLDSAIREFAYSEGLDIEQTPALKIQCLDLMLAVIFLDLQGRQKENEINQAPTL